MELHATVLEWLATLAVTLGMGVNLLLIGAAIDDLLAVRRSGRNGLRLLVARAAVRRTVFMLLVQAFLFCTTALGLFQDSTRTEHGGITPLALVRQWALLAAAVFILVHSVLAERDRRRMIAYEDRGPAAPVPESGAPPV